MILHGLGLLIEHVVGHALSHIEADVARLGRERAVELAYAPCNELRVRTVNHEGAVRHGQRPSFHTRPVDDLERMGAQVAIGLRHVDLALLRRFVVFTRLAAIAVDLGEVGGEFALHLFKADVAHVDIARTHRMHGVVLGDIRNAEGVRMCLRLRFDRIDELGLHVLVERGHPFLHVVGEVGARPVLESFRSR